MEYEKKNNIIYYQIYAFNLRNMIYICAVLMIYTITI